MATVFSHQHSIRPSRLLPAAAVFILLIIIISSSSVPTESSIRQLKVRGAEPVMQVVGGRKILGSWPPTCKQNCGKCSPCKAVHIPIQPTRFSKSLDYYPEAWRCKCGNKIFMPSNH